MYFGNFCVFEVLFPVIPLPFAWLFAVPRALAVVAIVVLYYLVIEIVVPCHMLVRALAVVAIVVLYYLVIEIVILTAWSG